MHRFLVRVVASAGYQHSGPTPVADPPLTLAKVVDAGGDGGGKRSSK
jgi:hypothetical protein